MARFSVVTETAYKGNDGGIIVDCTWFSVSAFESAKIRCLDQLAKGKVVRSLAVCEFNVTPMGMALKEAAGKSSPKKLIYRRTGYD